MPARKSAQRRSTWLLCSGSASRGHLPRELTKSTILLIILILLLVGAMPAWPYSRSWGYGPSGGLGLVLIILLILVFMGRV